MDKLKILDLIKKVLDEADRRYDEAAKENNSTAALKELGKGNGLVIAADIINEFFGRPTVLHEPVVSQESTPNNETRNY